jgi:23S rRNA pseudouridine1911/1915/1917 synthase
LVAPRHPSSNRSRLYCAVVVRNWCPPRRTPFKKHGQHLAQRAVPGRLSENSTPPAYNYRRATPSPRMTNTFRASTEDAGKRLDQYLAAHLDDVSRTRVQQLITEGKVLVNDAVAKASLRLRGSESIAVLEPASRPPLRAVAENIPLEIVYEDGDLAVINKPAGMLVHAGAGDAENERNRGTLVNAVLHHFRSLSNVGGDLRPGIVHRLDKATSGLVIVAKNDSAHRSLAGQFSGRQVKKNYIALVHGWLKLARDTISTSINRDRIRRIRMTTRRRGGREAITHYRVRERVASPFGKFSLLDVEIDTGRTHQIRVHLASLGHPVVGDTLYGAPRHLSVSSSQTAKSRPAKQIPEETLSLPRNFLHAASIQFDHPKSGARLEFARPMPEELEIFLTALRSPRS